MANPTTSITTPLALNQTSSASIPSPWFVQQTEYNPRLATLRPLVNGEEAFGAVYDAIHDAKHSVDIICWGFQPSMFFRRGSGDNKTIGQLLVQKGKEGVKVRLLCWHDDWYISQLSENNMPGYDAETWIKRLIPDWAYDKWSTLIAKDYQSTAERLYDSWWYYCANLNNVTMVGTWDSAVRKLKWFTHYPFTFSDVEFATRDFTLDERRENMWRLYLRGKDSERDTRTKIQNAFATGLLTPTHHQKMVLIDYEDPNLATGFVMGHNMLDQYWDKNDHSAKRNGPGVGRNGPTPWQDMSSMVTGPILQDLNDNFCLAWDGATGQSLGKSRKGMEKQLKIRPGKDTGSAVMAQIVRTRSQKEKGKKSVTDIEVMYLQAANNATRYVFIQNQYFRWVPLAEQIKRAALAQTKGGRDPGYHGPIHLFVITNSDDAAVANGTFNTYRMLHALGQTNSMPGVTRAVQTPAQDAAVEANRKALQDALAQDQAREQQLQSGQGLVVDPFNPGSVSGAMSAYTQNQQAIQQDQQNLAELESKDLAHVDIPSMDMTNLKVHVCTLVAPDSPAGGWVPVYVHAKLMTIDDAFTTLGSANLNSRSMEGDSELNICTEHSDVAQSLRRQLWGLHTGEQGAQDEPVEAFKQWGIIIKRNTVRQQSGDQPPVASLVGFLRSTNDISRSD
ncbi:phospholipase D-like domain-containing protein [Paraburkholderia haematera]|uniref:Cardiolipin synthase n=1 Tax=Paraburkholderia haematera TaxID=2793077 RepID=A0ABM8QJH1_9BURK|nr:phosphatidylserine/phosphatidylglycerophosphate/cardiolipin synthase family protein [Paraburkholderia haematera]CAE6700239.1 Cardiolipin synthase [Paraburkholderia haematera]